ncbi:MAG: AAA family ATPase, partial [Salibacteraceae bacterium]
MLKKLHISNFALIERLTFEPAKGFSSITGETGAGKSIILGALGLILGKRSEGTDLFNTSSKCIIEGVFEGNKPNIKKYLLTNDFDVEKELIIRREILPSGKSRAFINDTPAKLNLLASLGELLLNIHSQHGHLELKKPAYVLRVLDSYCGLKDDSIAYEKLFDQRSSVLNEIKSLEANQQKQLLDFDYFSFLYNELEELDIKEGELSSLESELSQLQHGEEIQSVISNSISAFEDEGGAIVSTLIKIEHLLDSVSEYSTQLKNLLTRIKETRVELEDVSAEFDSLNSSVEFDPARIEECTKRVNAINLLLHKHKLSTDV